MSESETPETRPGWYDDGSGRQRYWDGTGWTEHFADSYAAEVAGPTSARGLRALWSGWNSRDRWVAVGSAAGTVIGLVGLVVPLVIVDRGASGDTIAVHSQYGDGGLIAAEDSRLEPVAAGLSASAAGLTADGEAELTWAVPVDAPWEELFALHVCEVDVNWNMTARGEADTAAADAWIERHGVPTTPHHLWATITNTAGTGVITVSSIRPQGTLTPAPDRVWVRKAQCGGAGDCSELINARIALGTDPVAVFGDPPIYPCGDDLSDIVAYTGDPVVFDVAPGQARPLYLSWTQSDDFTGRFVATLTTGGQTSTLDLTPGNADITSIAVNVPAVLELGGGSWLAFICDPDGNLPVAEQNPTDSISDCTLSEWLAMIRRN